MDQELDQLVQAIVIASDPTQLSLHQQALQYISSIQQNAATTWKLALSLFVDQDGQGSRKYPAQARFFALRVLDEFLDNRLEPLDKASFDILRQAFVAYIQSEYVYGPSEANSAFLRNKFSHTLTLLFLCTYIDLWPTFFSDLFTLIRAAEASQSSASASAFNRHVSLLFFHIIIEISDEVHDQAIKSAREYNPARHERDTRVRDAVRERDASAINEAVVTIVNEGTKMKGIQNGKANEEVVEVVDLGIKAFASYVGWIDINLTVTPTTIQLLFTSLNDASVPIRLAASTALSRIVAKGLKEPADKLQLIKVLSLAEVIDALESRTRQEQQARGGDVHEEEESYREALGRLLNVLGLELTKVIEEKPPLEVLAEATRLLDQTLPLLLRFLSDEYDDTCNTVFPVLSAILGNYKKRAKKGASEQIENSQREFLVSLLNVILEKLKWEEDFDFDDEDEEELAAFEGLRKDLRTFMDSVWSIDPSLVSGAVVSVVSNTLTAHQSENTIKWNEAELALYLIFIYGEINKVGSKGRSAFCVVPAAAPVDKALRKELPWESYPLTAHGEMLMGMVGSGIARYPHKAVLMQYFENVARYAEFFKVRKECIGPALEAMIDPRGLHNPNSTIRSRVFYLFHRFIKECRNEISPSVASNVLQSVSDLLVVQAELPELEDPSQDLLTEAVRNPGIFESQLYLFETTGILCSLLSKTSDQQQASVLMSIVNPLMDELSSNLQVFTSGSREVLTILRMHHLIMALGNIAKGFPDFPNPIPEGYNQPPLEVFAQVAQALLVCLEALNILKPIREATRFAFARILATTGTNVTRLIPSLMSNLLAHFEPSELVEFLNFINLLIHKLQQSMFPVLDELSGPLNLHIASILSQPVLGTDDQLAHSETKKAYLGLLTSIMNARLHGIFTSSRNGGNFESLLQTSLQFVEDNSDPSVQKAALMFLSRCLSTWAAPVSATANGQDPSESTGVPGFERFVYERILPSLFSVLASPDLDPKDGQATTVLYEIASTIKLICSLREQEAYDYLTNVFLPSQGWPPQTIQEFVAKIRELDVKLFRKYFTDFVRSSRS